MLSPAMSYGAPTSAPQTGRLFLRSHGDCFIHATNWWLKYWNFSLTKDRLAIVRVTLPTEKSFLTTLSPAPLPYENVHKGVKRKQYLEIDPKFARELDITPDTEVVVESIRAVEECTSLVLAPLFASDYDKLENFSEKIDYELTERIRVVSCRYTFPIWIDNLVISVKVVSSNPTANWVLLVPERTLVELRRTEFTSPDTGISIMSGRSTSGQGSSTSTESPDPPSTETSTSTLPPLATQQTAKRVWDFQSEYSQRKSGRRNSNKSSKSSNVSTQSGSSVDTSPVDESDSLGYSLSSILSRAKSFFSGEIGQNEEQGQPSRLGTEQLNRHQAGFTTSLDSEGFEPNSQCFPGVLNDVNYYVTPPQPPPGPVTQQPEAMVTQSNPSHRHLMNEIKHKVPVYNGPSYRGGKRSGSNTPDPSPPAPSMSGGSEPTDSAAKPSHKRWNTWHSGSDFNKHHPSSRERRIPRYIPTPRMCACVRVQPHSYSGVSCYRSRMGSLVDFSKDGVWCHERLFDIFVHPSTIPEIFLYWQRLSNESFLVEVCPTERITSETKENKASTVQEDLNDLKQESRSVASGKSSIDNSSLSSLPNSLVVRLCFATSIRIINGEMVTMIEDGPAQKEEDKKIGDEEVDFVAGSPDTLVRVGHVVMSDVARQQLGVKSCSLVRLLHVKDEWRVPDTDKPSVTLQPLRPEDKHQTVQIKNGFDDWVRAVSDLASVGGVLVDKQVIPLIKNEKGDWVYCRVKINRSPRRSSSTIRTSYLLVTPALLGQHKFHVTVDAPSSVSSRSRNLTKPVLDRLKRDPSPSREEVVQLPTMKSLNQPPVLIDLEHFRSLDPLYKQGMEYLKTVYSQPGKGGALLVCGVSGSGGSGCGKTSLARLLCKSMAGYPHYVNMASIDCTAMRGLTTHNFKKRLKIYFSEAILHQPSVILLDDLDHTMPLIADAQEQVGEEGNASIRKTQVLLDLIEIVGRKEAQVVVIATAQNKQQLNKDLLQSRGVHVFEKILEINPPSLADRKVILGSILKSKEVYSMSEHELRAVAQKTEGFQSGDLVTLVDRAISLCELRTLYPQGMRRLSHTPSSPDKPFSKSHRNRIRTDSSSSDLETNGMAITKSPPSYSNIASSPPLATPPLSPRKKLHPQLELKISSDSNPSLSRLKKTSVVSSDSTHTLIQEEGLLKNPISHELHKSTSLSQMKLGIEDFLAALKGFVPVSLRGLPLHRSGVIDFSGVGGLGSVKKCLRETLLWPSKYPRLFSQCPIKQRNGVLLYGAPGTGKTMLAGAVAKEFNLNFVSIKGPELLSKYIGASEQAVRDVFTRALCAKPCILFFDEFDSLAPRRGHDNTGVTDRVVNQLLTQLDGVESLQGVYILAASSRPDLIDPALLRPGRIDRSLLCDMPTEDERTAILTSLSRGMPLASDVNFQEISSKSPGLTGADLKAVLYSAQLQAAHECLLTKRGSREHSLTEIEGLDTPETSGRGSSIASGSSRRPLVFEYTSVGLRRNSQLSTLLETKALALQRKNGRLQRRSTLTLDETEGGGFFKKKKSKVLITQEQLLSALNQVQPSVSEKELKKFNQIYDKFTGKTKTTVGNIKSIATMA